MTRPKRRRLVSVAAAIVRLGTPAPAAPLVETPRCTSSPTCEERGLPLCVYCRINADGPTWWLTPREAGP